MINKPPINSENEVESVKCASCGFTEECTTLYIHKVRQRFQGRWICGLCIEAVKDEALRSNELISTEEALNRHINVCKEFRSLSSFSEKTEHPIFAMGKVLRRSLEIPKNVRSNSSNSLEKNADKARSSSLVRSESCFPSLPS